MDARIVAAILLATSMGGCLDATQDFAEDIKGLFGPRYNVAISTLNTDDWSNEDRFRVVVDEPEPVAITIEAIDNLDGRVVEESGFDDVTLVIPDGTWSVTYYLNGDKQRTYSPVRIDTTPPQYIGLERDVASGGSHVIEATLSEPADVTVTEVKTGTALGMLPVRLHGLDDGLHVYLVSAKDRAANFANATVQVRVGSATELPAGQFDFGVVARYTNTVRVWDISDPSAYLGRLDARDAVAGAHLGAGHAITPDHPTIQAIVDDVVDPDMNTMEAALALYRWMYDTLEYDVARLERDDLLDPVGTIDNGGGVCRDLAALYTSLLRAAGVPARLVSGYLAGSVNGFHAWVDFYGGSVDEQNPWIPVDVSVIGRSDRAGDDEFRVEAMLQSFGLLAADYLPLKRLDDAGEIEGWSSAMRISYKHAQGQPPTIRFDESVTDLVGGSPTDVFGALCVNVDTHERRVVTDKEQCSGGRYTGLLDDFLRRTTRTIDYGIAIDDPGGRTTIDAWLSFPDKGTVQPNKVEHRFYGQAVQRINENTGKAYATFRA